MDSAEHGGTSRDPADPGRGARPVPEPAETSEPLPPPDHLHQLLAQVDAGRAALRERGEAINARSGRNLGFAILIGILLGGSMLLSLLLVKELFILFGMAMVALLVIELTSAVRTAGRRVPLVPSVLVAVLLVPIAYYLGPGGQWLWLLTGIVLVTLWRLGQQLVARRSLAAGELGDDLLAAAFIQIYITFLGSFTVMLVAQERGEWWALGFLLVVVSIDTGAYVVGLNFGRHKLAPRISPGKTWEGLAGAAVISVLVAVPVSLLLLQQPWWFALVFAPLLLVTATAGDLTESMIKRDLGVKDMSSWLPGHGGFFDRLDSILPSGAMAFALYFWSAELLA